MSRNTKDKQSKILASAKKDNSVSKTEMVPSRRTKEPTGNQPAAPCFNGSTLPSRRCTRTQPNVRNFNTFQNTPPFDGYASLVVLTQQTALFGFGIKVGGRAKPEAHCRAPLNSQESGSHNKPCLETNSDDRSLWANFCSSGGLRAIMAVRVFIIRSGRT